MSAKIVFPFCIMLVGSRPEISIVVSSAYKIKLTLVDIYTMSFIHRLKKSGPRILP